VYRSNLANADYKREMVKMLALSSADVINDKYYADMLLGRDAIRNPYSQAACLCLSAYAVCPTSLAASRRSVACAIASHVVSDCPVIMKNSKYVYLSPKTLGYRGRCRH